MKKILLLTAIAIPVLVFGQSVDQNYILNKTYKVPTGTSIPDPSQEEAVQSITYFDGLGRPIQQVAHKQSGAGKDLVTHMQYDAFGRQVKEFLPIENDQTLNYHTNVDSTKVESYYTTPAFPGLEITSHPYSEKLFEHSPLNRVLKQTAPGEDWKMGSGHEVKFEYETNIFEEVRMFETNGAEFVDNNDYYDKFKLYKTITKDENWISGNNNTTEEFKDMEGHVILKRTYNGETYDTYYVYDDYGNLAFVLPPIVDLNEPIGSTVLDNLCYQYQYDFRNRLIKKKLPGKQWEYIAYNSQDMPVATGPAQSPWGEDKWGWMVTKYDKFGRTIYTGWYEMAINDEERQSFENQLTGVWAEDFEPGGASPIDGIAVSYTHKRYPEDFKLLTVNYYDTYNYVNGPILPGNIEDEPVLTNVKSLTTGSWIRVLDNPDNSNAEVSYTLYDAKGRPIRNHKTNYLGGYTTVDSKLDFRGKPTYTFTAHKRVAANDEIVLKDFYENTPEDRPFTHIQAIIGQHEELIAKNDYNDLGQLITKQVGGQDLTTFEGLQKVDYQYNIRGWLTGINNENDGILNTAENDLFLFKINYNTVEDNVSNQVKALYNGNISETFWRTKTDDVLRKYGYQYDNLNRLTNSFYQKPGNAVPITNMYDESMSYDKNGNIQHLQRNGDYDSNVYGPVEIDNLNYTYDNYKKNQLKKVDDSSNSPKGFKDIGLGYNDYDYDANGNMVRDDNKGIESITYNHLNLPVQITFGTGDKIKYLYDAVGEKVMKTVSADSTDIGTDYLDGYQYTDGVLNFFPHAEGYVNVTYCPTCQTGFQQRFNYVYQYKDHLGNVRVSFGYDQRDEVLKIIEENHYYPFGLKHTKYNTGQNKYVPDEEFPEKMKLKQIPPGETVLNKYKYNGKEYQDELGLNMYDYGARNYDPALGRWMNMDPLAEQGRRWSPYTYALDNPVYFLDPDGMWSLDFYKDLKKSPTKSTADESSSTVKVDDKKINNSDETTNDIASLPPGTLSSSTNEKQNEVSYEIKEFPKSEPKGGTVLVGPAAAEVILVKGAEYVVEGVKLLMDVVRTTEIFDSFGKTKVGASDEVKGAEHTKGKSPSKKNKHEAGQKRKQQVNTDKKRQSGSWNQNPNGKK